MDRPLWASIVHPALIPPEDPESPLYLWRDTERFGRLFRRTGLPPAVAAEARRRCDLHTILMPAPDDDPAIVARRWHAELMSVLQRRGVPGAPDAVFHHPRATWDRATRRRLPMAQSAKARRTADPHETYAIRDDAGVALPFPTISISEVRVIPERDDAVASRIPATAVYDGSFWMVTAFL